MSVADAARLTHIRPDRILDLEKDDYSNFPSLAYARGFLLIYARLLGVDVADAASRLENSNPVDIEEYEYLSGKPAPLTRSFGIGRKVTTVLVVVVSILLGGALVVRHFVNDLNRLDDLQLAQKDQQALHSPTPAPSVVPEAPTPAAIPSGTPEVKKAETAVPSATMAVVVPAVAPDADKEVTLHPVKKAWVKIQKDSDDSEPVYEDWLYPDAGGLTLHGKKFYIQLSDGSAVEVRKNGQVVPYNSPGIVIQ